MVLVSGDNVLGGPQSGIILGRADLVKMLKKSPLARVLRPSKLEVAALAATLTSFLHPDRPAQEIPTWRMFAESLEMTRARAELLKSKLAANSDWQVLELRDSPAQAGSGTLPATPLPSIALVCLPNNTTAARWSKRLRQAQIPIMSVVQDELVLLNLRTGADSEVELLATQVLQALE